MKAICLTHVLLIALVAAVPLLCWAVVIGVVGLVVDSDAETE